MKYIVLVKSKNPDHYWPYGDLPNHYLAMVMSTITKHRGRIDKSIMLTPNKEDALIYDTLGDAQVACYELNYINRKFEYIIKELL